MQVPFVDLKRDSAEVWTDLCRAAQGVIEDGRYILGPDVGRFEAEFASFCETGFGIGVASGTDALLLSLRACGVGGGDRVLVPSNTFIATFDAVARLGAVPVPVDPHPDYYTIDAEATEARLGPGVKAVVPVHLYGQSADIERIAEMCRDRSHALVEDAAQAHGARFNGRRAGSFGACGCFSFYPSKNLGALGDGGAVVTADEEVAARLKMLRDYGQRRKNVHEEVGYNSRLDSIQAAVLRVKLPGLEANNEKRAAAADLYRRGLAGVEEVSTPTVRPGSTHVYHLFVIRCSRRDELKAFMEENGIGAGLHYPVPPHLQPAYAHLGYSKGDFPVAERLADETLTLPMFPSISPGEVEYVCETIGRFYSRKAEI